MVSPYKYSYKFKKYGQKKKNSCILHTIVDKIHAIQYSFGNFKFNRDDANNYE